MDVQIHLTLTFMSSIFTLTTQTMVLNMYTYTNHFKSCGKRRLKTANSLMHFYFFYYISLFSASSLNHNTT